MTPDRVAELQCSVGIAAGSFAERLAATGAHARALYRAVLPVFAATGTPPPLTVAAAQAELSLEQADAALRELDAADLVALDASGVLVGAFPLSAVRTRHRVRLRDGRVVYAMCAVDALGIPAMLGEPGTVSGTEPTSDRPITVEVGSAGVLSVDPTDAVVLLASTGCGSLANACCSVIDFYASRDEACRTLVRPGMTGGVLTVHEAHAFGVALFVDLPSR